MEKPTISRKASKPNDWIYSDSDDDTRCANDSGFTSKSNSNQSIADDDVSLKLKQATTALMLTKTIPLFDEAVEHFDRFFDIMNGHSAESYGDSIDSVLKSIDVCLPETDQAVVLPSVLQRVRDQRSLCSVINADIKRVIALPIERTEDDMNEAVEKLKVMKQQQEKLKSLHKTIPTEVYKAVSGADKALGSQAST